MLLRCGSHKLDLSRPLVMGVINVTPDSFSDGGRFANAQQALEHAMQMVEDGAAILDVMEREGRIPNSDDLKWEDVIIGKQKRVTA